MSHSPGPWFVNADVMSADGKVVARPNWDVNDNDGSLGRWKADSALIARAPEMLALLRRLAVVSYDAELGRSGPGCSECGGLEGHVGHTGEFGLDPCQLAKFLAEIDAKP